MMMSFWAPVKVVIVVAIGLLLAVWATGAIGNNFELIRKQMCGEAAAAAPQDSGCPQDRPADEDEDCFDDLEGSPCGDRREAGCRDDERCCAASRRDDRCGGDCCRETTRERCVRETTRERCYDEDGRVTCCRERSRETCVRRTSREGCCDRGRRAMPHCCCCCGYEAAGTPTPVKQGDNGNNGPGPTSAPPPPARCKDGAFGSWYARDLARLDQGRGLAYTGGGRAIRVLAMPYFSRGPILYKLEMDARGAATLTTIWLADDDDGHYRLRHSGQHDMWRWADLRSQVRQRRLKADEAWRLWALAGEISPSYGGDIRRRRQAEDCVEEGNWLVVEEAPRRRLHIAPLRSFDRRTNRDLGLGYTDESGFDNDRVSERPVVRSNAETRFFCALVETARTPPRVLVRADVSDVCHNMIRDPPLDWGGDGDDPYGP
jgi:hypothetical protein